MRLMAACKGNGFEERSDAAIVNLFYDPGMRRAELAGLRLETSTSTQGPPSSMGRAAGRGRARSGRWPLAHSLEAEALSGSLDVLGHAAPEEHW